LRGSGRFLPRRGEGDPFAIQFQSPSLRGSGRFAGGDRHRQLRHGFQSPSLRGSGRFLGASAGASPVSPCFNPLHCGAVVASGAA